jgi:hypothetical protein
MYENVGMWFNYSDARTLENRVKFNVAVAVEGWLNGARDSGYEPVTKERLARYTYEVMQESFAGDGYITSDRGQSNSLHFYSKAKTMALIEMFINQDEDLQPYLLD